MKTRCIWINLIMADSSVAVVYMLIITARNEVGARLYFHRRVWFCSQGGSASVHAWIQHPPQSRPTPQTRHHPLGADPPGSRHSPSRHPPRPGTPHPSPLAQSMLGDTVPHPPPRRRACWEIRSTRGWYASYWNAILYSHFSCSIGSRTVV